MTHQAYITCRPRPDGGGALIHSQASVILCAKLKGLKYLHQPVRMVGHNPPGLSHPTWDERWEKFFAFGQDEDVLDRRRFEHVVTVDDGSEINPQPNTLYNALYCHELTYRNPASYYTIRKTLRERFFKAHDIKPRDPLSPLQIVAHVRRGDITSSTPERYTSDENVCSMIDWIIKAVANIALKTELHVCSEGNAQDFASLAKKGAYLHLNGDPFDAFMRMTRADVLIGAKSSFSWLAAFLSEKIAIFEPCYLMLLPDWLIINPLALPPPDLLTRRLVDMK